MTNGMRKELLAGLATDAGALALDRLVGDMCGRVETVFTSDDFAVSGAEVKMPALRARIDAYWAASPDLIETGLLLGRWGTARNVPTIRMLLARLQATVGPSSGPTVLITLRWYPLLLSYYSVGIGAILADNGPMLSELFLLPPSREHPARPALGVAEQMLEELRGGQFAEAHKAIEGMEHKRVPASEVIFERLAAPVQETLNIGAVQYEEYFDRFEVLQAMQAVCGPKGREPRGWAIPGRFQWKLESWDGGPFAVFEDWIREASAESDVFRLGTFVMGREGVVDAAKVYKDRLMGRAW